METSPSSDLRSVSLSASAAGKVAELLAEEPGATCALRVYVTGGGCSGMQYGFALETAAEEDDFKFEQSGVLLLVDAASLQYVGGAHIDFEEGLEGSRFVIHNPNAATTCGCGNSFTV